jgi:hypothetical protein
LDMRNINDTLGRHIRKIISNYDKY